MQHYHEKASKACRVVVYATFALDTCVGALPPKEGELLYIMMARMDPIECQVVVADRRTDVEAMLALHDGSSQQAMAEVAVALHVFSYKR